VGNSDVNSSMSSSGSWEWLGAIRNRSNQRPTNYVNGAQINCESTRTAHSVNDYADLLVTRLEKAHEIVRTHLGVLLRRMKDWYDRKVHVQIFEIGDEVYVLNLRL